MSKFEENMKKKKHIMVRGSLVVNPMYCVRKERTKKQKYI